MDVSPNNQNQSQSKKTENIDSQTQELILKQLKKQVGSLPTNLKTQVMNLSASELEDLAKDLLDFSSLDNLIVWFKKHN